MNKLLLLGAVALAYKFLSSDKQETEGQDGLSLEDIIEAKKESQKRLSMAYDLDARNSLLAKHGNMEPLELTIEGLSISDFIKRESINLEKLIKLQKILSSK